MTQQLIQALMARSRQSNKRSKLHIVDATRCHYMMQTTEASSTQDTTFDLQDKHVMMKTLQDESQGRRCRNDDVTCRMEKVERSGRSRQHEPTAPTGTCGPISAE